MQNHIMGASLLSALPARCSMGKSDKVVQCYSFAIEISGSHHFPLIYRMQDSDLVFHLSNRMWERWEIDSKAWVVTPMMDKRHLSPRYVPVCSPLPERDIVDGIGQTLSQTEPFLLHNCSI